MRDPVATFKRIERTEARRKEVREKIERGGYKGLTEQEKIFAAFEITGFPCKCGRRRS